jgi:hypothetical protein
VAEITEKEMEELWLKSGGDIYVYADLVAEHERKKFCSVLAQLHDSYSCVSYPSGLRSKE